MNGWLTWAAAELDAGLVALALIAVVRALPRIPAAWRVALLAGALIRVTVPFFPPLVAFPGVTTVGLSAASAPNVSTLVVLYVFVATALLLLLFIRVTTALRSVLRVSVIAPSPPVAQRFEVLARRLGVRSCALRLSPGECGPLACGLIRPVVVIPERLLDALTTDELDAVLLHELTHHARRDLWLRVAASIVTRICWFNPVVWWLEHELRRATEEATDDAAVAHLGHDVWRYSRALVRSARSSAHSVAVPAAGLHPLGRRLLRLSKYGVAAPALGIAGWVLCTAVGLGAMFLQPMQRRSRDDDGIVFRNRIVLRTASARDVREIEPSRRARPD